jgi:hypothetical protein
MTLSNKLWGISHNRSLSPGGIFRWALIEPSEGTFDWSLADYRINDISNRNSTIVFSTLQEASPPSWAVTSSFPRLDRLSNYVYQVVNRYKTVIRFWEGWNELQQHGAPNYTTNQEAQIEDTIAQAVKTADPTAYFVAFGGDFGGTNRSSLVWNLMNQKTNVDAVSVHLYPGDTPAEAATDTRFGPFAEFGAGIGKPVWHTESGAWGMGIKKSQVVGWSTDPIYIYRSQPEEVFQRAYDPLNEVLYNMLRSFGYGFPKYYYYDNRIDGTWEGNLNTVSGLLDADETMRPDYPAILWLKYLIDTPTSYAIHTHPSASSVRAYLFGNDGNSVALVWSEDKTNRIATVTNSFIGQFDQFGNLITTNDTTLAINKHPWAWFSSVLTTNQMAATFTNSALAGAPDTSAPNVSIDTSPTGDISSTNIPVVLWWTAIDDTYRQTPFYQSNVLTRFKLTGADADWSAWAPERFSARTNLGRGTYQLLVQAKDKEELATNQVNGPTFTIDGGGGATGIGFANQGTAGTVFVR